MSLNDSNDKDEDSSEYNGSESDDEKPITSFNFSRPVLNRKSITLRQAFPSSSSSPLDVLYCKARGMTLDHISSNSILQFKPNEENAHGAELFCSHSVCKSKGVKFRYCAFCKKAVAKRNFRNRHAHLGMTGARTDNQMHCQAINQNGILLSSSLHIPMDHYQLQQRSVLGDITDSNVLIPSNSFTMTVPKTDPSLSIISNSSGYINEQQNPRHFVAEAKDSRILGEPVPLSWLDLYRERPLGGSISEVREWQQKIMTFLSMSPRNSGELSHVSSEDSTGTTISNPVRAVKKEFEGIVYRQNSNLQVNTENFDYDCISLLDSKGSIVSFPYGML